MYALQAETLDFLDLLHYIVGMTLGSPMTQDICFSNFFVLVAKAKISFVSFFLKLTASQQTQARGTRMGCRRAARVTPRRAVAGFDAGIHTGPVSFIPVNTLCRVLH